LADTLDRIKQRISQLEAQPQVEPHEA
jgi:hypothetical protein